MCAPTTRAISERFRDEVTSQGGAISSVIYLHLLRWLYIPEPAKVVGDGVLGEVLGRYHELAAAESCRVV